MVRGPALAILAALAACSAKPAEGPVATGSAGSAPAYEPLGHKPADARRATPPPDIAAKAIAVGAQAPAITGTDHTGAPWALATELTKHARVMLVFYRGDW